MHLRRSVRHIVLIYVRVEEQIRRVRHPDAMLRVRHARRHAEAVEEDRVLLIHAVAVSILVNGNPIHTAKR